MSQRAERLLERPVEFPYPVLVADIGGTNARIARVDARDAPLRIVAHVGTADHQSLQATIKMAEQREATPARSLIVSAAGPLEGRRIKLTNAAWTIDGPDIADELRLDQGLLLNDFEAQAIALPHIRRDWARPIGGAVRIEPLGPQLTLGPGTGLGAAALLRAGEAWLPVVTEAGHMSFGPADQAEALVWAHLQPVEGRITCESVLSGPGLRRLYSAVRAAQGLPARDLHEAEISVAAASGEQAAADTIKLFWRLIARCAGDLALVFLPYGGVTLAGGVLPHLIDWLDEDEFRRVFEDKAPMAALIAGMPVRVLTEPQAVLAGLAALAAAPSACALDYASRLWRR